MPETFHDNRPPAAPEHAQDVVIIGAGPAGLTAAYVLTRDSRLRVTVLEASSAVGGISQTAEYNGYLFDIGGHRFFTKVQAVEHMWREVLGADLLTRRRVSRIYYNGSFFDYPLRLGNVLKGLGLWESFRCGVSYALAKIHPQKPEDDFEAWVSNRFGARLFEIFFKSYTEKVWGMPTRSISAAWASQRIQNLTAGKAIAGAMRHALGLRSGKNVRSLIQEFLYPRRGPGMMWTRTRDAVVAAGANVVMNSPVSRIHWAPDIGVTHVECEGNNYAAAHFISSMALRDLIRALSPAPPAGVLNAANCLKYRDFVTVALILRGPSRFPDNWIYVHEPRVRVGRIQNFGNWSPEMVPDPATTCLGLEFFCFENDGLWNMEDADLVALAGKEVIQLGLAEPGSVLDGTVVRMAKAYPVYDAGYKDALAEIRQFLPSLPNLQTVGRNGMHRYNNQDHSMLTAMLAARNILGANFDVWAVNDDSQYHEEGSTIGDEDLRAMHQSQPLVPEATSTSRGPRPRQ